MNLFRIGEYKMKKAEGFYPRKILSLEILKNPDDEGLKEIVENLNSPLGLSLILTASMFTKGGEPLLRYKDERLDETKKIAFGLGGAEESANIGDKLAKYSLYQFAFQQFIQSSSRARQGKALERILEKVIEDKRMKISPVIASSKEAKVNILMEFLDIPKEKTLQLNSLIENALNSDSKEVDAHLEKLRDVLPIEDGTPFNNLKKAILKKLSSLKGIKDNQSIIQETVRDIKAYLIKDVVSKHDIDVLAKASNKAIIIQIRSKPETGGTTAKGSLAELLKDLYEYDVPEGREILYIIYVWVRPESGEPTQKISTINKLIGQITPPNVEEIKEGLSAEKVVELKRGLKVSLLYGAERLIDTLWTELGISIEEETRKELLEKYAEYIELVSGWDDLWIAYGISTLEVENFVENGKTNMMIIEEKLSQLELTSKLKAKECFENYDECSREIATMLSPHLRDGDDLIPFSTLGDKLNYLRDMILLRVVYEHIAEVMKKLPITDTTRKQLEEILKQQSQDSESSSQKAKFQTLDKFGVKKEKGD